MMKSSPLLSTGSTAITPLIIRMALSIDSASSSRMSCVKATVQPLKRVVIRFPLVVFWIKLLAAVTTFVIIAVVGRMLVVVAEAVAAPIRPIASISEDALGEILWRHAGLAEIVRVASAVADSWHW